MKDTGKSKSAVKKEEAVDPLKQADSMAASFYRISAISQYELENYQVAIKLFERVITLAPDAECFNYLGVSWSELGDNQKALEAYDKAAGLDKKNAVYFRNRGQAEFALKLYERAQKSFEEAIICNPTYSDYFDWRGVVKRERGNYVEALEDFNAAIRLNKKQIETLEIQTEKDISEGKHKEVTQAYQKIKSLRRERADYFNNLAFVQSALKLYSQAEVSYSVAIELNSGNAGYFNKRGLTRYSQKNYQGALEDFKQASKLNKDSAIYFHNCGDTEYNLRQYADAEASFTQAINLDKTNADYFNKRGNARFDQGNYPKAIEDYKKAVGLDKNSAVCFINLGNAEYQLELYQDAVDSYGKALALKPNDSDTLVNLAKAYKKLGKISECVQSLKTISQDCIRHCYAGYILGRLIEKGLWGPTEEESKEEYYAKAYEGYCKRIAKDSTDAGAFYRLAVMYEYGRGVERDSKKALDNYRICLKLGTYKAKKTQEKIKALEAAVNQQTAQASEAEVKQTTATTTPSAELLAKFDGGVVHTSPRSTPQNIVNNNNTIAESAGTGVAPPGPN